MPGRRTRCRVKRGRALGRRWELRVDAALDAGSRRPPRAGQELEQREEPQDAVPDAPVAVAPPARLVVVQVDDDGRGIGVSPLHGGERERREQIEERRCRSRPGPGAGHGDRRRQPVQRLADLARQRVRGGAVEPAAQRPAQHPAAIEQTEQRREHGPLPPGRLGRSQVVHQQHQRRFAGPGAQARGVPARVQLPLQGRHVARAGVPGTVPRALHSRSRAPFPVPARVRHALQGRRILASLRALVRVPRAVQGRDVAARLRPREEVGNVRRPAEGERQVVPGERPDEEPGAHQGHPLDRVVVRRAAVELEAVGEHRHRRLTGRGPGGPDEEVGAAGLDDAVRGAEVGLLLHVVGVRADLQHVAGPAAHEVGAHLHGPRAVHLDPAQRFDEARLQLAVERRVDGETAEARHLGQLVATGEDAVEHLDRGVAGRLGHLAAAAVGEHATVAAVLLRVPVAGAGPQRVARLLEDRQQLPGLGHQLLEITGATRHGVVQQQVLMGRAAAVLGHRARSRAACRARPLGSAARGGAGGRCGR